MAVRQSRPVAHLHLALLTLVLAALPASAQNNPYTDRGSVYNPYTGQGGVDRSGYNPLTRTVPQAAAVYNPYTGANRAAFAPTNPYKGVPQPTYNALTGQYGSRADQRSSPGSYQRRRPITGKSGPGLEKLDEVMLALLEKHGIPGGALAIVKDGKLVLARGYGWGNLQTGAPVTPDAIFAIASLSKALTAVAVLKLVEEGKLQLEDKVFPLLAHLKPPPGARVDPRLSRITVRQLLHHSGGWDSTRSGDPWTFSWRVAQRLRIALPVGTNQLTRYMLGERLDFDPGTQIHYSNYGFIVLGQVIEKVSGMAYGEYVSRNVLKPMGLLHARLPIANRGYHNDEVRLYAPGTYQLVPSNFLGPLGDASGGWRVSAVDLARFLAALDGSRAKRFLSADMMKQVLAAPPPPIKPNPSGTHLGLGWDAVATKGSAFGYFKDGLLPGSRTFMGRTLAGVNYVMLFNSGERLTTADIESELHPRRGVEQSITATLEWPRVDYFDSFK